VVAQWHLLPDLPGTSRDDSTVWTALPMQRSIFDTNPPTQFGHGLIGPAPVSV